MVAEVLEATDARNNETLLRGLTFVRDMLMPELEASDRNFQLRVW